MGKSHGHRASGLPPSAYDRPRRPPPERPGRRAVAERQAPPSPGRRVAGPVGRHRVRPHEADDHPSDDGRGHRRAASGGKIRVGDQWLTDWASCNYLGFDLDEEIIATVPEHLAKWGTHPSWSRLLGKPAPLPRDRGADDRTPRLRGRAGAPDDHADPLVGHPDPRRATARSSSTAARTRRSTTAAMYATSHGATIAAVPARRLGAPRGAARGERPDAAAPHRARRRELDDGQRARRRRASPASPASTTRCCTSTTRTASA